MISRARMAKPSPKTPAQTRSQAFIFLNRDNLGKSFQRIKTLEQTLMPFSIAM